MTKMDTQWFRVEFSGTSAWYNFDWLHNVMIPFWKKEGTAWRIIEQS